jgi:prolyl-tRNA synthetase
VGAEYLERLGATFTAEDGTARRFVMGCYGLGISRTLAAIVEVHHDDRGIRWPKAIAPYEVGIVVLGDDPKAVGVADSLERDLDAAGIGCVVDDRAGLSPGVKFADADLIGYPLQIVIGKTYLSSGKLEAKVRATGKRSEIEATTAAVREALEGCP